MWEMGREEKSLSFSLFVRLHSDLPFYFHYSVKTRIGGTFATNEGQKHFRLILLADP